MKNENKDLSGRIKIEYLDKHRVQIELDNKSIDFLIEVLSDLKNEPGTVSYTHLTLPTNSRV